VVHWDRGVETWCQNNLFLRKLLTLGVHNMFISCLNFLHLKKDYCATQSPSRCKSTFVCCNSVRNDQNFHLKRGLKLLNYNNNNGFIIFLSWTQNLVSTKILDWTFFKSHWCHSKASQWLGIARLTNGTKNNPSC
jgi:hypothetical protein